METPSTKVTAATAAAAVAAVLIWVAQALGWIGDVPTAVEAAFATLLTLAAGYFVPERRPSSSARATIAVE